MKAATSCPSPSSTPRRNSSASIGSIGGLKRPDSAACRSQNRRDALDVLALGEKLVSLTPAQLARLLAPEPGGRTADTVAAGAVRQERGDEFAGVPDFADLLARAGR